MTIQEKLAKAEAALKEVQSLRTMQKEYFRHRDQATLDKCKIQEKKIDQMIDDYFHPKGQQKLW